MFKLIFFLLCSVRFYVVDAVFGDSDVLQYSIFPPLPVAVSKSVNTRCKEESDMYMDNLKNFTLWAHEMWDATAKSSTGVLRGSMFQMGHFEQCISARSPFTPKYCLATITAETPEPKKSRDPFSLYFNPYESVFQRLHHQDTDKKSSYLVVITYIKGNFYILGFLLFEVYRDISQQPRKLTKVGWCIPSSCTIHDLENNLNEYLANVETRFKTNNVTYRAKFSDMFCHTVDDNHYFDKVDISFCFLASILVILVLLATTYDHMNSSQKSDEKPFKRSLPTKIIMAFSARENFNELNIADNSNPALSILYGVRTICILAIIVSHRFGTFISSAILNFNHLESQYRSSVACLLFHGDLFVDTFFLLSGLLVVYGLLNQYDKRIMNPAMIVLLRYIRLTPVYAFVIFYYATIFNHSGDGPLWKVVAGEDSKDCRKNWWTNLLYISNYVNPDHMCMTHSWYLPCDFHYFIIAIFLCILIKKEKKFGLGTLTIFTILSMAIPFAITIIYQRPGLMHFYPEFLTGPKVYVDFLLTYSKSHARATPYFVGMFAGYIYYKLKGTNKHICRTKTCITVLGSIFVMLVSVFSAKVFYDPYHPYNAIESASYAAFHRLGWAVGSAGLFFVASFGHASFFKQILSWSPWIPLSKLVYGAYLTHMSFQLRSAAKFMNPRQLTYFDVLSLALSDIVLAFTTALCLYLMIEAPFRKIFRELLMPSKVIVPKNLAVPYRNSDENMINSGNSQDSRL